MSTKPSIPPITVRSVVAGLVLSVVLCAMNSYLTLSFGVIEEGPTIAALFFFAIFFLSKTKITATETLTTIAIGSIVAEGIGGVLQSILVKAVGCRHSTGRWISSRAGRT